MGLFATDDKPWTIDSLDARRDALFAESDGAAPPFFSAAEG
jgi:hypothetical protein